DGAPHATMLPETPVGYGPLFGKKTPVGHGPLLVLTSRHRTLLLLSAPQSASSGHTRRHCWQRPRSWTVHGQSARRPPKTLAPTGQIARRARDIVSHSDGPREALVASRAPLPL